MNGSRPDAQRSPERSSLDALNRTIEGLEARIEGLIGQAERRERGSERPAEPGPKRASDPLTEIIERQRSLLAPRERLAQAIDRRGEDDLRKAPGQRSVPETRSPDVPQLDDIVATLRSLRSELTSDIRHSITADLAALRAEIAQLAERPQQPVDTSFLRAETERLGRMMTELAHEARPADLEPLRVEFDELRALIARKASQESLTNLERRWDGLEARLDKAGPDAMHEEIVALAWRLEDMKNALGALDASPAIRKLEDKLIALANAVEGLGRHRQDDSRLIDQFQALDERLDEISRAIAAGSRATGQPDAAALARVEERLNDMTVHLARVDPTDATEEMIERLSLLGSRIEELADRKAAERLEARIADLSATLDRFQQPAGGPDYSGHFADLSRKIDTLDVSDATAAMIDRLERLAARIEDVGRPGDAPVASERDDDAFQRLEDRLSQIAARLDQAAPAATDAGALASLERQIANLSALLNDPRSAASGMPAGSAELESRMLAIEDYIASNDEYILEAARHAAETVVEAYGRQGGPGTGLAQTEIAALSGLAEDLRALEDFARSSDERNWRTFEALHDTLVQISDRLNTLDDLGSGTAAAPAGAPAPQTLAAAPVQSQFDAAATAPAFSRFSSDPSPSVERSQPVETMQDEPAVTSSLRVDPRVTTVPVFADDALEAGGPSGPAARAAEPDTVDAPAAGDRGGDEPAPSKSLIVNLSRKIMGRARAAKAEKPAKAGKKAGTEARTQIEPTPALDATDVIPADDLPGDIPADIPADMANTLIQPGTGAPDVKAILARVRADKAQAQEPRGDKTDIIAAARRAAEAAAAELGGAAKPAAKGKDAKAAAPRGDAQAASGSLLAKLGDNRRPVLLAAGAILLVLMSYPLVTNLIKDRIADAPQASIDAPQPTDDAALTPADPAAIAPVAVDPATTETAPVEASPVDAGAPAVEPAQALEAPPAAEPAVDPALSTPVEPTSSLEAPADASIAVNPAAPVDEALATDPAEPAASTILLTPESTTDASGLTPSDAAKKPADTATIVPPASTTAIEVPAAITNAALVAAAKSGDSLALFEIGARFTDGIGVPVDLAEAARWYRLSAEKGFAPAEYRLANFLEKGTGVERNIAEAIRLYESAAGKGNASAMHNLAVLLSSGAGGAPDLAGAAKWFEAAARHGVTDSQYNLAILHARGNGVAKDFVATYTWFAIAAKAGDKDAAQKRDEVAQVLTPQELEKAKAAADLFKPATLDPAANSVIVPDAWAGKPDSTASVDVKKAIRNIQAILNNNGFDAGKPDGEIGARTLAAIKAFQKANGMEPTGKVDEALVRKLLEINKPG